MDPLAFVSRSVDMDVNAESMCLIGEKLSDVDVSPTMPESALAMRLIVLPFALVYRTALPFVDTISVSLVVLLLLQLFIRILTILGGTAVQKLRLY